MKIHTFNPGIRAMKKLIHTCMQMKRIWNEPLLQVTLITISFQIFNQANGNDYVFIFVCLSIRPSVCLSWVQKNALHILLCLRKPRPVLHHQVQNRSIAYHLYFNFRDTWWRHQIETFSALLAICAGNSPVQWRGALRFSLICVWINGQINNREAGDLRRYRAHYDVTVMGRTWQKEHCEYF